MKRLLSTLILLGLMLPMACFEKAEEAKTDDTMAVEEAMPEHGSKFYMVIHHKVNDFATWKTSFDDFADARKAGGELSWVVLQDDADPNSVTAIFMWSSMEEAKTFAASDELKARMEVAGVTGPPEIHFLNETEMGTH